MAKRIAWTAQAKADVRAVDRQTAMRAFFTVWPASLRANKAT